LFSVDVMLQLKDGTALNAQWERLFKATGDDGNTPITGHAKRYHAACDDKEATMTVIKA
jgi:hypothetical protein